jgi:hypothetical protein
VTVLVIPYRKKIPLGRERAKNGAGNEQKNGNRRESDIRMQERPAHDFKVAHEEADENDRQNPAEYQWRKNQ